MKLPFRDFVQLLFVLALLLPLLGCAQPTPGEAGLIIADVPREESPAATGEEVQELAEGNTAFAFDLYQRLRAQEGNLFYSPYSISAALAMTYAGARGDTAEEMAETLNFTLPQEDLHPAFNALDQNLTLTPEEEDADESERFTLNIANSLWGQEGYPFREEFLETLARNYGAGLRPTDFAGAPEESREAINNWVEDATEDKIQNLIPPGHITPDVRLVLANAIYFNAVWRYPFLENTTNEGEFRTASGEIVQVPMMSQSESFSYAEGDGWQALELPYRGRNAGMVILLPEEGSLEEFEAGLDVAQVQQILGAMSRTSVEVTIPKFEYEAFFDLSQTLQEMGMVKAFNDVDFSGMVESGGLFISSVLHKAFVSVDEEGTEAAAATAVIMVEGAMMEDEDEVFTADHPFLFLIVDHDTDSVLFVGRVSNPVG